MAVYIYKNNQQLGPFGDAHIIEGLRTGTYLPTDLACCTGMKEWGTLNLLYSCEIKAIQSVFKLTPPKQQRCAVCGYAGLFKNPPFIYMRDLVISVVLFAVAGAGLIWFIISVLQKKPLSCPNCKAKGNFNYEH